MTTDSIPAVEPDFVSRHIGPNHDDVAAMLKVVGQPSLEAMLAGAHRGECVAQPVLRARLRVVSSSPG